MFSNLPYYYQFKQVHYDKNPHGDLRSRRIFRFKSHKNHTYLVEVEGYQNNTFVLKFYLKSHSNSPNKYNTLTNIKEPRGIIYTCIAIIIEIYMKNKLASFGFIGAPTLLCKEQTITAARRRRCNHYVCTNEGLKEPKSITSRYKFYQSIVSTLISEANFIHLVFDTNSAYILLNREHAAADPEIGKRIVSMFGRNYGLIDESYPVTATI